VIYLNYSVLHISTVCKEFGRLKTELLILRLCGSESIAELSTWHAPTLRFCRTVNKILLDWYLEICGAVKELKDADKKVGVVRLVFCECIASQKVGPGYTSH